MFVFIETFVPIKDTIKSRVQIITIVFVIEGRF